jgi:F-type H+-transporting ATPase subunit epsilon
VAGTLDVRVVSAEAMVHEGSALSVTAPAWDGQVGILPGHAPMITLLGGGMLTLRLPGGGTFAVYVAGGVLKVENGVVTVLAEYASPSAPAGDLPAGVVPDEDALRDELRGVAADR